MRRYDKIITCRKCGLVGFYGCTIYDNRRNIIGYRCDRPECTYHRYGYNKEGMANSIGSGFIKGDDD